jgi:hypothetical protein
MDLTNRFKNPGPEGPKVVGIKQLLEHIDAAT